MHEISRKKPILKNRIEPEIESTVVEMAISNPAYGQLRASNELRKQGIFVSPTGVRCVWLRYDLETPKKRLKVLEVKSIAEGLVLTEAQVIALESAKEKRQLMVKLKHSKVAFAKVYDRKNALVAADMLNDRVLLFYEERGIPLLRVLTDRRTEYCGAREYHEHQLYLAFIWRLRILMTARPKLEAPRQTVSVND